MYSVLVLLFVSSRRRHTSWPRDWSSDVCSSDLSPGFGLVGLGVRSDRAGREALLGRFTGGALYRRWLLLDLHPAPAAGDGGRDRPGPHRAADSGEAADHVDCEHGDPGAEL